MTAEVLNEEFKEGDEFVMTSLEFTREDVFAHGGSALSFVHGINPEYGQPGNSFYNAKSRMRWGSTAPSRDGTVWVSSHMRLSYLMLNFVNCNNHLLWTIKYSSLDSDRPLTYRGI